MNYCQRSAPSRPTGLSTIANGVTCTIAGVDFVSGNADYAPQNATWAQKGLLNPSGDSLDRFEVRSGDRSTFDVGTEKERSEYGQHLLTQNGTTVWVSYAIRVTQDVVDSAPTVGQFHPTPGVGDTAEGSNLYMAYFNGTLRFNTQASTDNPLLVAPAATKLLQINPIVDRWVNYVHQIKCDPTGSAAIWNVWQDGIQILASTAALGFASSSGNFWKFGIYRAHSDIRAVAWYSNMEVSSSSLAARVSAPKAVTAWDDFS